MLLILTVCIAGVVFSLTNDRLLAVLSGMFPFVIFFPPCLNALQKEMFESWKVE
jgi:hypothetical protein